MPNNSASKTTILIVAAAVIALALMLFVNAMSIRDFSQPGRDFLYGRSNVLLAVAFVLAHQLTGVAAAVGAGLALPLTYVVLIVLLERIRLVPHGLVGLVRSLRADA